MRKVLKPLWIGISCLSLAIAVPSGLSYGQATDPDTTTRTNDTGARNDRRDFDWGWLGLLGLGGLFGLANRDRHHHATTDAGRHTTAHTT